MNSRPATLRRPSLVLAVALIFAGTACLLAWLLRANAERDDLQRFEAGATVFRDFFGHESSRYRILLQELGRASRVDGPAQEGAWRSAVAASEWRTRFPYFRALAFIPAPDAAGRAPVRWLASAGPCEPLAEGVDAEATPGLREVFAAARGLREGLPAPPLPGGGVLLVQPVHRSSAAQELVGFAVGWFDADAFSQAPLPPGSAGLIERRVVPFDAAPQSGFHLQNFAFNGGGLRRRFILTEGPLVARQSRRWIAWVVLAGGNAGAFLLGWLAWRQARMQLAAEGEVAALHSSLAAEREIVRLKSAFVNTVSHEFRTPLGVILSSADLLHDYSERLSPERRAEHLQNIRASTRRMADMVEHILLLGRIDSGRAVCDAAPCDLPALARRLVDEATSATHLRCPIALKTDANLAPARADEVLLRHIFSNLLDNAVKYSPVGAPVEFSIARAGSDALFTIADHGIGMTPEDAARLGEPFHRGANATHLPGTGLGWVIVRRAIELHAGSVESHSSPDAGTTITVRLPLFSA